MAEVIKDGSTGDTLKITDSNRASVDGIVAPVASELSRLGKLFGTVTGSVSLTGSESLSPMLWLQCDDPDNDFFIEKLIYGWDGGTSSRNTTVLAFIKYQSTEPSGAQTDAAPAIENIKPSGPASAITDTKATALKWDGTGSSGMTGGTGGYLQIPNRIAIGNTSIPIEGQIILGQGDTMQIEVTPDEAGLFNAAIVYYKVPVGGRL